MDSLEVISALEIYAWLNTVEVTDENLVIDITIMEQIRLGHDLDLFNCEVLLIAGELFEKFNERFNLSAFSG